MNARQRDQFLFLWSRRRQRGATTVGRLGAWIGAGGGLLFTLIMLASMGPPDAAGYTGLSSLIPVVERASLLLVMTVPTLAAIGRSKARRVFMLQESMYLRLLSDGAQVPATAPTLKPIDRWPALLVGGTVLVLGGFVLFVALVVA